MVVFGLLSLAVLAGCGGGSTTIVRTATTAEPRAGSEFTSIPTVKCRTIEGVERPAAQLEPTTPVAIPAALSKELSAYRDTAGTLVVAPSGFDCSAGIGVDGGEVVVAYPKGAADPSKNPLDTTPGTRVSLNISRGCQGCIAAVACTFFPEARAVKDFYGAVSGSKCPEKPLREKVSYPAPSTAMFVDPPQVHGTGLGSGGIEPSFGEVTYFEPSGTKKLSCTLPPKEAELCESIIGATFAAAPLE
jgi:hypothetical protein